MKPTVFRTPPIAEFLGHFAAVAATPETESPLLAAIADVDGASPLSTSRLPAEVRDGYDRALSAFHDDLRDYRTRLEASDRTSTAHPEWRRRADRYTQACADEGERMLSGFVSWSIAGHLARQRTNLRVPHKEAKLYYYDEQLRRSGAEHRSVQGHLDTDGASPEFVLAVLEVNRSFWEIVAGRLDYRRPLANQSRRVGRTGVRRSRRSRVPRSDGRRRTTSCRLPPHANAKHIQSSIVGS